MNAVSLQVAPTEVGLTEVGPTEVGPAEVGPAEAGRHKKSPFSDFVASLGVRF